VPRLLQVGRDINFAPLMMADIANRHVDELGKDADR
jgi:hypothetical protein